MAKCKNCKYFESLTQPVGKCLVFGEFTYRSLRACHHFEEKDYVKHELFERKEEAEECLKK